MPQSSSFSRKQPAPLKLHSAHRNWSSLRDRWKKQDLAAMLDYTNPAAVFPADGTRPYDQNGVREIETFRKTFGGVLFIDRVLRALGIGEGKAYPPKGDNGLRGLHQQVCESKVSAHHKLSILYYLLLDFDGVRGTRSILAEEFSDSSGLPKKYQILMRGLWHMDREQFKFALEYLAHPSLPPEFADEIISILVRRAESNDYSLALAYYHTTQPVLKSTEALNLLFGAIARTSVTEAFYFSRKYSEQARQQLFQRLITSALDAANVAKIRELISLPLDEVEDGWFQDYLTKGDGRKLKRGREEALELRQIVTARNAATA